jgi:hypothetical protein
MFNIDEIKAAIVRPFGLAESEAHAFIESLIAGTAPAFTKLNALVARLEAAVEALEQKAADDTEPPAPAAPTA